MGNRPLFILRKGRISMSMKINEAGFDLVKSFEGYRLTAYKCPAGVWTIGYGHTGYVDGKAVCEGMIITKDKAAELLRKDMEKCENAVNNCTALTFKPNENQFSALVSFTFNCGAGNLIKLVSGRSADVVADKLLLYVKANGKVLNGLVRRRKAERELFLADAASMDTAESYYLQYTGTSKKIDIVFREIEVPDKFIGNRMKRKPIALVNGFDNYTGKASENLMLISLAKDGRLKKA